MDKQKETSPQWLPPTIQKKEEEEKEKLNVPVHTYLEVVTEM